MMTAEIPWRSSGKAEVFRLAARIAVEDDGLGGTFQYVV